MDSIEELKQEVYSLRNKLATATSQEAWYNDEIAQLQTMRKQESEIQDALKEEVIRLQRKAAAMFVILFDAVYGQSSDDLPTWNDYS
uniref:Uncharacterized protein n=1 Tax=Magallana gigas TaxID=29159 RepID=A0A8W8K5B2_MAGGI